MSRIDLPPPLPSVKIPSMVRGGFWMIASALSVGTACGGEVRTGGPEGTGSTSSDAGHEEPGQSGGSGSDPGGQVTLGQCKPGFALGTRDPGECVFFVDDLCYEKKLEACACACKKQSGTLCISGFPELNGTTHVTCD